MANYNYEILNEIARQQNIAKAAAALHMTRSAVSHSLSTLESQWGLTLFVRERTGVRLTEAGEAVMPYVREALEKEELISEKIAELNGRVTGKVMIAAFSSICINWLPDLMKQAERDYPEVELSLMQGDYGDVAEWVRTGIADIGFESLPFASDLQETPVYEEQIVCVTSKDYVPENGRMVSIADIEDEHLILQRSGYNQDTMDYINMHNINARSKYYLDDDRAILAMVASGAGICLMPELVLKDNDRDIRVWPLAFPMKRTIGILTKNRKYLSPTVRRMRQFILDYLKDNGISNV